MLDNPDAETTHRNMLEYKLLRSRICLHLSFSCQAYRSPMFWYSAKSCVDAATAMIQHEPDPIFRRLTVIGGGLFKAGTRIAYFILGLDLVAQTRLQHTEHTLSRLQRGRDAAKGVLEELLGLYDERMRNGQTNVKDHMVLSTMLAEVQAVETGASPEVMIAQSARDSVLYCLGGLREQNARLEMTAQVDHDVTGFDNVDDFGAEYLDYSLDFSPFFTDF